MTDSSPDAGWYADPQDASLERWWNGIAWSEDRRPTTVVPPAPPAPADPAPFSGEPQTPPAPAPPGYGAPQYGAPGYGAPQYGAPGYGAPVPGYATPTPTTYQPFVAPGYGPAGTPAAPPGAGGYAPQPVQNQMAFIGMIIALVGLVLNSSFFALPGIAGGVLGIIGLRKAAELEAIHHPQPRRGQAIVAIATGFGGALLTVIGTIAFFALVADPGFSF